MLYPLLLETGPSRSTPEANPVGAVVATTVVATTTAAAAISSSTVVETVAGSIPDHIVAEDHSTHVVSADRPIMVRSAPYVIAFNPVTITAVGTTGATTEAMATTGVTSYRHGTPTPTRRI